MTRTVLIIIILFAAIVAGNTVYALDPPHDTSVIASMGCSSCHKLHGAVGVGLTTELNNYDLCLGCHNTAPEVTKRLPSEDQASPGISGTSHSWTATMQATGPTDSSSQYGLRAVDELSLEALKVRLGSYGNVITCSVCHDQHSQTSQPWDPNAPGSGDGRHLMRLPNDMNELCEDCHYYRTVGSGNTDVSNWNGGTKKSHPVVKIFTSDNGETPDVTDSASFMTSPAEPEASSWAAQTGARYHVNGGGDGNATNNFVTDANGAVRCLTCHGIHYTDSDSSTVDGP
jgi:predicted CXXCH cytochrome family protein